jgi:hypoxanthine phosphoribosyltransferase
MMKRHPQPPARKRASAAPTQTLEGVKLRVVFTAGRIRKRVRELAAAINRDYKGKTVHVVGILENSFIFMADLVRHLKLPVICHFVKADVRDGSTGGGVAVREIMYTPRVEAAGKDILLVDGILQSGVTQDHYLRYILGQMPASIRTVTLVEKTDERKVDTATDYVGFKITGKFLVGYGLGYQERLRNLPYIAQIR